MKTTPIHPQQPKAQPCMPFVPAFEVERGKLIFVAGCGTVPLHHKHPHVPAEEAGWVKGDRHEQTLRTFGRIRMILAAAGADLRNGMKRTTCLQDVADQAVFNEVSVEMFGSQEPPPRTVVQRTLNHVNMKLEIDVMAAV